MKLLDWFKGIRISIAFPRADRFPPTRPGKRRAVIIGLTNVDPKKYGGWDGACPGCDIDARVMRNFYELNGVEVSAYLLNGAATIAAVESAILAAGRDLDPTTDTLFIENSCHGGRQRDTNGDEADGMDETICLYDGQWLDDRVVMMLAKLPPGLRVVWGSDSCHSGTNTRAVHPELPQAKRKTARIRRRAGSVASAIRIVHLAGCSDANYSYGSSIGGVWTKQRIKAFKPGMTYRQWFLASARNMPANQAPQLYCENGFADEVMFS